MKKKSRSVGHFISGYCIAFVSGSKPDFYLDDWRFYNGSQKSRKIS